MIYKTLDDYDFNGKRVLVRADLNSPVVNGKVMMNERIRASAVTLRELSEKGARVVVLAHQSRPGKSDFTSLEQHAKLLNKFVSTNFVDDVIHDKAMEAIVNMKKGEVLLLENVRKVNAEFEPSVHNVLVVQLALLFDVFVNDAFSVSHREHTSVVSFPQVIRSCVGRVMERELNHLEKIKVKNCLYILGGAKMKEVVGLIDGKRKVLTGSLLGGLIHISNGKKLGWMDKLLRKESNYHKVLKGVKNVKLPVDFGIDVNGKRRNLELDYFPMSHRTLDIGKKTIKMYKEEIRKAKSIFVKGPMGLYEEKAFSLGTKEILKAVAKSKALTVIGGGHTSSAIEKLRINRKKFDYVSLSGGALVDYISGKSLPGLDVLKKRASWDRSKLEVSKALEKEGMR